MMPAAATLIYTNSGARVKKNFAYTGTSTTYLQNSNLLFILPLLPVPVRKKIAQALTGLRKNIYFISLLSFKTSFSLAKAGALSGVRGRRGSPASIPVTRVTAAFTGIGLVSRN